MVNPIDERPATAPEWVMWPVRVFAVIVVLPFRLLWEAMKAVGRFLDRFVLAPLGWVWRNLIVGPAQWLWRNLVVVPGGWVWRNLVVVPGGWVWRNLIAVPAVWAWRYLIVVPLGWVRRGLRPVLAGVAAAGRLVMEWVVEPVGRFLRAWVLRPVWWLLRTGWQGTSWLGRQIYRWVLRPVGIAAAWVWRYTFGALFRGLVIAWRATVVPVGRWLRDEIVRPAGAAVRSVLAAVGLLP